MDVFDYNRTFKVAFLYACFSSSEPNMFKKFNKSISPEELTADFTTLREILKSNPGFGNFLVGPDVTRILNHSKSGIYLER